jgi:ribosomal protein S15P/S13E
MISTRMKQMILSVNGDSERKTVREFVDTYFLAMDARAFRKHIAGHQPDVNLLTQVELSDGEEDVEIPITVNFFWPDANL